MTRLGLALGASLALAACFSSPPPPPAVCNASTNTTCDDNQICALDKTCVAPGYTDNQNGTVTDTVTGLIWQQAVSGTIGTWDEANTACADLTLGGAHNWRLPRLPELNSLTDLGHDPAVEPTFFPNTPHGWFWSASQTDWQIIVYTQAWIANSDTGNNTAEPLGNHYLVRCVRDEDTGNNNGCTCAEPMSCTDSCGNVGAAATACSGLQCSDSNSGDDTCGQPQTFCQPSCSCADPETCTDSCGHSGAQATQCVGLVCDAARDGKDSCGVADVSCG